MREMSDLMTDEFLALTNERIHKRGIGPDQPYNLGTATSVVVKAYEAGHISLQYARSLLLKIVESPLTSKALRELCDPFGDIKWMEPEGAR
jgi:hypothetical protein